MSDGRRWSRRRRHVVDVMQTSGTIFVLLDNTTLSYTCVRAQTSHSMSLWNDVTWTVLLRNLLRDLLRNFLRDFLWDFL